MTAIFIGDSMSREVHLFQPVMSVQKSVPKGDGR